MIIKTLSLGNFQLTCEVAGTPTEKARGLQGHAPLSDMDGMLFEFSPPQLAVFHMASVDFPLDIVFCHRGQVAKIIPSIAPGSKGRWSAWCDLVLEVRGNWCADHGVQVGAEVAMRKNAAQTYDLLRTLTTASSTPTAADVHATFRQLSSTGQLPDLRKLAEEILAGYARTNPEVVDRGELSQIERDRVVQDWSAKSLWERELQKLSERGKLPGYDDYPEVYRQEFAFAIAAELPAVLAEAHEYFESQRSRLFAVASYLKVGGSVTSAKDIAAIACASKQARLAYLHGKSAQQIMLVMAPLGPSYLDGKVEPKFYDLLDLFDTRAAKQVIESRWVEASKGFDFLQRDAIIRALVDSGYPDAVSLLKVSQMQSEPDARQDALHPGVVRHTNPDQSYAGAALPADTVGVGDAADTAHWDASFGYDPTSVEVSNRTEPIRPSASKRCAGGEVHPGDRVRAVEKTDGLKDDQKGVCLEVQGDMVWIKFDGEPIPRWLKNDLVSQETPKEQVLQEIDQGEGGEGGKGLAALFG